VRVGEMFDPQPRRSNRDRNAADLLPAAFDRQKITNHHHHHQFIKKHKQYHRQVLKCDI